MYVSSNGKLYVAPAGSEFLACGTDGVPVAWWRAGWVAPMLPLPSRLVGKEDA